MTKKITIYYIARGSVRGSCGHKHRTLSAANACCQQDQRDCYGLGGGSYSDRSVWAVEDGNRRELTENEHDQITYLSGRQ